MCRDPVDLTQWTEEDVHALVDVFLDVRFPTILLLNKADQGGDSDRNIERIVNKYDAERCFVGRCGDALNIMGDCFILKLSCCFCSAAAELFLKQASRKNFINYVQGQSTFMTKTDVDEEIDFLQMRGEQVTPDILAAQETLVQPEPKV